MAFNPQPKPAKGSGRLDRHERRKSDEQALLDAYAEVDLRDGSICWVTGRFTKAGDPDARRRREHHHLKGGIRPWSWRKSKFSSNGCNRASAGGGPFLGETVDHDHWENVIPRLLQ
jgi:hypothetical protein